MRREKNCFAQSKNLVLLLLLLLLLKFSPLFGSVAFFFFSLASSPLPPRDPPPPAQTSTYLACEAALHRPCPCPRRTRRRRRREASRPPRSECERRRRRRFAAHRKFHFSLKSSRFRGPPGPCRRGGPRAGRTPRASASASLWPRRRESRARAGGEGRRESFCL